MRTELNKRKIINMNHLQLNSLDEEIEDVSSKNITYRLIEIVLFIYN